ncbi:hypothetical protein BDF14DRAFT_1718519, partial [Spinellus fusiger]
TILFYKSIRQRLNKQKIWAKVVYVSYKAPEDQDDPKSMKFHSMVNTDSICASLVKLNQ